MRIRIEIKEADIKQLIINYLCNATGQDAFEEGSVIIETKSKQNYKSEWEVAAFRATYEGEI